MSDYSNGSSRRRTSNTSSSRRAGNGGSRRNTRQGARVSGASAGHSSLNNRGKGHNKRRKKNDYDITQILMYGIGAIIVILCIALAVRGCRKASTTGESAESSSVSESSSAAENQITVDGVDITGMTQDEAREAILKQYNWNMKVKYQDKEASVNNILVEKVNNILEEIYAGDMQEAKAYETDQNLMEAARAEASLIAGNWSMVAKNGGISGYDKETGKFTFSEGTNGLVIDQDKLAADMVEAVHNKDYDAVIEASVKEVSPELTAAQLKEKYKTIATYTTKTTSNSNRNENIRLACVALNGTIINPGQEFSFNETTGARTEAKGYKPATAYLNGEVVQEPGGGVCQVSSTLYNAVIFAGLKSTERHAHSYEPSYVTPGEDAMVSFGGPDMKFVNTSSTAIAIRASFADRKLKISIVGIPILEKGVTLSMTSKKTAELDAPAPVYEEDQTLQPGEEKIVKAETKGSRWVTNMVTKKDGVVVSDEFFHNSTYRGKPATIRRNTSGVVVPATDESASGESTISSSEGETLPSGGADTPTTTAPTQPTTAQPDTVPGQGPGEQPTSAAQPTTTQAVQPEGPGGGSGNSPGQNVVPPSPLS